MLSSSLSLSPKFSVKFQYIKKNQEFHNFKVFTFSVTKAAKLIFIVWIQQWNEIWLSPLGPGIIL